MGCSQSSFMREVHNNTGQTQQNLFHMLKKKKKLRKIPNNNVILHPKELEKENK